MQQSWSEARTEEILTSPHEYIRDSSSSKYKNRVYCKNRTDCYSCHWKREQLEEIELLDK